jgi:hypothetical protein
MNEAGGLDDLQVEIRALGVDFDVVVAGWRGDQEIELDEIIEESEFVWDNGDPDGEVIALGARRPDINQVKDFDGDRPARMLLDPDRKITWLGHGHGRAAEARQVIIDTAQ